MEGRATHLNGSEEMFSFGNMHSKMKKSLGIKGRTLLKVLVAKIEANRRDSQKSPLIFYSEALDKLGKPSPWIFSGRRLQREGMTELNEWTKICPGIPHVCGLIVNKKNSKPSGRYPESHGRSKTSNWEPWWRKQVAASVTFNWKPHL